MTHMKVMLRFPLSIRINIFTGKDCCMQGLLYLIPILRCYFIGKQREEIREIRDIPGSCLSKSFMPSARKAMFQLTHFILWLLPLHKILIRDCCKGATTRMSIVYVYRAKWRWGRLSGIKGIMPPCRVAARTAQRLFKKTLLLDGLY